MRSRTTLVSVLAAALIVAMSGPAAAGNGHGHGHGRPGPPSGGDGIVWSDPGPVDVAGRIGSDAGQPDALRYVGDLTPKTFSDDYIHADPFISAMPENGPVTIAGTLDLTDRIQGTVGVFGLVEQSALEEGGTARDSGALLYLLTRDDGSMRIGPSDGRPSGEIIQVSREFPADEVPDTLLVTFTIDGTKDPATCADRTNTPPPTTGGCMTVDLEGRTPTQDSYGTIKVAVDEEFLHGAVPGWEMFQGQDTGIGYTLTIDPARTGEAGAGYPTSKWDCKKGGYVRYGFRNQGECVSWVARHGRGGAQGHGDVDDWKPSHHTAGRGHTGRRSGARRVHWGPVRHSGACVW